MISSLQICTFVLIITSNSGEENFSNSDLGPYTYLKVGTVTHWFYPDVILSF